MAKVDIIPVTPLDVPDDRTFERIAVEASKGSDANLPIRDRRDRGRISDRTDYAPGTILTIGGERMRLHGPGRGNGWMLLAWVQEGSDCYGTFHESQVTTSQEAPRTEPTTPARTPKGGR